MVGEVVRLQGILMLVIVGLKNVAKLQLTLNAALYGTPIGILAKIARTRLANADRKARLWEIS